MEASYVTLYAMDEHKWYIVNSSQGSSKFSVGTYVNTMDYDVAPLSACNLLLGRPWQFDLDATHGCHSNCYSFVHKGIHHVFKSMLESVLNLRKI
jgi:hypothetical protein